MFALSCVEPPRVAVECGSVIMVRQLLIQTEHLTLLSSDQVAVELEAGWLACIGDAPGEPTRVIGVTTRVEWRPTPIQRVFLDALEDEAKLMKAKN
jgi:DNA-binding transcriptional LysR family regulator